MGTADDGRPRRPVGVTVLSALVVLLGVLDIPVGLALLAMSGDPEVTRAVAEDPQTATLSDPQMIRLVGGALIALGIGQIMLAVLLFRGLNVARLALTLVLVVRFGNAWYLLAELQGRLGEGAAILASSGVALYLLWNPGATAYFERDQERALAGSQLVRARRSSTSRLLDFVVRLAILGITITLAPGVAANNTASLLLAVLVISLAGWALSPLLARVTGLFGWFGALLLALFGNAMIIGAGLALTPGVEVSSVGSAVLASWIYALIMTVVTWLFAINSRDYLLMHAARMSMRVAAAARNDVPGVLFVQLDGVPAPLLEQEIRSGNLVTISRWVRSGSHTWTEWVARVPSTTPVSQAGLLHGDNTNIPAFRWYDRGLGRLIVANRPADAALIESRVSDGRGLLADEGVSISNLFSGDAPTSLLTMSGLRNRQHGLGPSRSYAAFFTHPAGFVRAVLLTIGEMVKEVFQAHRQERRGLVPRVHRSGSYIALRGATNVFLRDLNVALVVEAMMRGAKSIYVDFVDYDEIAHHAGVTRPESLAALRGLDDVLGGLESLIRSGMTARPYHIVLVSDHGQSQGTTFSQRCGQSLEDLVAAQMTPGSAVAASTQDVETRGPVHVLLQQLADQGSVSGRLTRRALSGRSPDADNSADDERPALMVIGSGNLGGVWFPRHPERLLLSDIEALHPGLVDALAGHRHVGFVVVMTVGGPAAIGADGVHDLVTGQVTGTDPLTGFGPHARADFLRAATFDDAPDLYLNSLYDPVLDEVAAFEELVGCHGGLGGWQTRPLLVYPAEWELDEDLLDHAGRLYGADAVHRQLVRWLERLGHRANLEQTTTAAVVTRPHAAGPDRTGQ